MSINELGASACSIDLVNDANHLKNMLIDNNIEKAMSKKKKKGPGSRRRLDMKYKVEFTTIEFAILYGSSMIIEATASALGR
jgi:hypothetical protein